MSVDPSSQPVPAPGDAATAGSVVIPSWLQRLTAVGWRVLVTLALLLVIGLFAAYLSTVTGSILVGLTVAASVAPIATRLRNHRGWPRGRAAAAASVVAVLLVVVALVFIIVALVPFIAEIIRTMRAGIAVLTDWLTSAGAPPEVFDVVNQAIANLQAWILANLSQMVGPIASFTTILILGGFLTFYLLEDGDRAWFNATGNLKDWQAEALTNRATVALAEVGGYLRRTAVMAVTDALTTVVFLLILGVPLAGPLAVLVFIGGFVPYLGGLVTAGVLATVTLATRGTLPMALLIAGIVAVKVAERRWLAPRVAREAVRVSPAVALIAIPAAGVLFGLVGMFAAVPVLATISAFAPAVVEVLGTGPRRRVPGGMVPLWLDRLGQFSWRALIVLGLFWVFSQLILIPILSLPVILALLLACVLKTAVDALERRGIDRTMGSLTVTAVSVVVTVVVVILTIATLLRSLPEIVDETSLGAANLHLGTTPVDIVQAFGTGIVGAFAALTGGLAGVVLALVIALLLTFYFLRDGRGWWAAFLTRVPIDRRERVDSMGVTAVSILNGSMVGTAIVSLAGAALQWITMVLLGLPLAFPISVLMFFGGFIPYIGSAIVTFIGFLVAVAVGSTADIVLMAIFTLVFNIVQGNIVAPLVYGRTVSVHPAVVLLAAPAGAAIGGLIGMVLIVPIVAIILRTWHTFIHLCDMDALSATAAATSPAAGDAAAAQRRAPPAVEPGSARPSEV
ncbi:MAG TPA: AI-2E family transporter [Candidatus Limnocylindrales bacterium]|jgi:predicted PurR-regulated permease PerM